jgi:alkaline phosphatase D
MSGDVAPDRAIIWAKTDRAARMVVEYSTKESLHGATKIVGPTAFEPTDFTARVDLTDLPPGQTIFYRVTWRDLESPGTTSEPSVGRFRTPSLSAQDVSFVWGGDTCGQGWGIDVARGGMTIYESMRQTRPDFFLHSGDTIYADNPLAETVKLDDGTHWKNLVTPAKRKVAETLDEFRGNHAYNLLDANVRAMNAEVPMLAQWDDHETTNNWFPGEMLDDPRYTVKSASLLAARAGRAFREYMPMRLAADDTERIYRHVPYGPLLDVMILDQRTDRGPNTTNRQATPSAETAFMGPTQVAWLKRTLASSTATWKVIASDMPIGLVIGDRVDGKPAFEASANGVGGPPLGREHEIAEVLRFIKERSIANVVWVTADVHYAAAHHYDPARAAFKDFTPFWEFVGGPLHAGTFGPNELDPTFGIERKFLSVDPSIKPNRPPSEGKQFFGHVRIDGQTQAMKVSLRDRAGKVVWSIELAAGA